MPVLTRRLGSFGASLAIVAGMSVIASPAQAAVGVDLNVNDTSITEGESITLSWTSTEAIDLVATGEWSGNKSTPAGDEVVTPATTGDLIYTLTATDENGRETTDSVTVTVTAEPITPNPVTFPDPCIVVIPETANVTYFINYGGSYSEPVESGTFPGATFYTGGSTVRFYAEADEGFTLAEGATTSWRYTATDDCLEYGPQLVTTTVGCKTVRFTNIFTETIFIQAGDPAEEVPDVTFNLSPGASRSVATDRSTLYYSASYYAGDGGQNSARHTDKLAVPQGCGGGVGSGSDHPTVAPAAGSSAR